MTANSNALEGITFFKAEDFIDDLKDELTLGFSDLKIIIFKLSYAEYFKKVLPQIYKGLDHGAHVEFYLDGIYAQHKISSNGLFVPLWGEEKVVEKKSQTELYEILDNLRRKQAEIHYYNDPNWVNKHLIPFAGRDHRKIFIIKRDNGERIGYFGATNMDDGGKNDFMIKVTNPEIFEKLELLANHKYLYSANEDLVEKINPSLYLIEDIGINFKSAIQDAAYTLIENAKDRVIFVSQLPAEPVVLWSFIKALKKGVDVSIIIPAKNHKQVGSFPYVLIFWTNLLAAKFFGLKIFHCIHGFTHAKILICDDSVLLGSHNLSNTGVAAGTVELSALVHDAKFLEDVEKFVNSLIS